MADKKKQVGKKTLVLGIIAVLAVTVYLLWKIFGDQIVELFELIKRGNEDEIAAYLNSQSSWGGYFVLFIIQALQVVSIFFPGMVIQIAGALIYGWWRSFLICWLGFVFGNALVFVVARVLGKSIQFAFASEGKKENWLMQKINDGNPTFVVAIACLVPGVPNGIIPYIAARTKISVKSFVLAVACSSWIQIILNCIAGHFLRNGQYMFMIFAFAIQIALIVVISKNRDKILNRK